MSRHLLALALAAAIGAAPMAMDLCVEACEAMHMPVDGAAPACHHATSPVSRVDQVPEGCGHDHAGTTTTVARDSGGSVRTTLLAVLRTPGLVSPHAAPLVSFDGRTASPPPDRIAPDLALALRI